MSAPTMTVGGKSDRLDLYPGLEQPVISDRVLTNKLLDLWGACIDKHAASLKAVKRVDKLAARIEASDLAWNHPHRIEANLELSDRNAAWEGEVSDYKHALACFVGLIQLWCGDEQTRLGKAFLFGSRKDERSLTLLEGVYREPELVEGQHLWPEMIEAYEHNLPDHLRTGHWREQREIAERQRADAIESGKQIPETEWRTMYRRLCRLDDVPF